MRPENSCINCHFFKQDFEQKPREINSSQREVIRKEEIGLIGDFSYGCWFKVWDAAISCCAVDVTQLYKNITEKERNDCFFFPYNPGMMFEAAEILQKREFELNEASKDRQHTIWGLWIAGGGLVVGAIIGFIELVRNWNCG